MDIAALTKPTEGARVEFWTKGMKIVHAERGIVGVFKGGRFWSQDLADHWNLGELKLWCYPR